jgi:hypothetical protein
LLTGIVKDDLRKALGENLQEISMKIKNMEERSALDRKSPLLAFQEAAGLI